MGYVKYINPIDILFLTWILSPIESFHPCDLNRFYNFIEAIIFYKKTKGSKWYNKDYFYKKCKEVKPYLDNDLLDTFYNKFEVLNEYFFTRKITFKKNKYNPSDSYVWLYAIKNEILSVDVSIEEFYQKNITKKLFLKLYNERNQ